MAALAVRAASDSCPENTQWYVCAKGGYSGCCSVDPCTVGVCADDSSGSSSSSSSSGRSDTTTSKTSSTSKSTAVEVKTKTTSTSTSSSTISTTTIPAATHPATTTANTTTPTPDQTTIHPTTTPTTTTTPTHHQPNRINQALIAGVVGGILALLILAALVLYSIYRARKRRRGQFRLLHWRHPGTLGSGSPSKEDRLFGEEEGGTEMVETNGKTRTYRRKRSRLGLR
ncbi:uncharacterized protein BO66DRAFT_474162 [Aspergillus aculeatinus CBS 121060]|uniref:Uncharacterized protein n=1 Tax=Aspergillus aculeatinus CBS 121060 TaxID=1448322 RepID=A0ACD1GZ12_9EURO|nr:hypothetical protein BO66DRAFT_474162 [Aspergillus aculeatinus CBS 121060]RAH66425.1 hypothetical protein BO66DRAFT_474162 [Aspergillus aculeatinus CBS 121060]